MSLQLGTLCGQEQHSGFAGGCDVAKTKVHLNLVYPWPVCTLVSLKLVMQILFSHFSGEVSREGKRKETSHNS